MPRLTIQVVGWNSAKELPETCAALATLPSSDVVLQYIDNGSTDDSVQIVTKLLPQAALLPLARNEGFAGAHNAGLVRCQTPFVLIHDPDVQVTWSALSELLAAMDADQRLGAVQGKLHRHEERDGKPVIDSAGIELTIALNGRERGSFETDEGQYMEPTDLIAVTGACGLYRISALREVAHSSTEFFDADFFAYKEDVDLGWRLRNAGWRVRYLPVLIGIHRRTLGRRGFMNWGLNPLAIHRRLRSPRTRYSLRNWIWTIIKNASFKQLLLHELFIDLRALFLLILGLTYPPLLSVWLEIIRGVPRMIDKRRKALHHTTS